jgi:predicted HTH domain antitoxin
MTITLPSETLAATNLDEKEIKTELAIALYSLNKLTLVQAAELAETGFFEFQELLKNRAIPQHYSEDDLVADQATIAILS